MPKSFKSHAPAVSTTPHGGTLGRLRQLSYVLDNAIPIPGTGYRIGLDPILGLIPGAGDTVAGLLSTYIVVEAARLGMPVETLIKMVLNILLETVLGSVPILGDIFDATWKANVKNMALLESHLGPSSVNAEIPRGGVVQAPVQGTSSQGVSKSRNYWILALLLTALVIFVIGFAVVSVWLVRLFLGLLAG